MSHPRIVCLGGGTGLSALLAGLRRAGVPPTAIVSTFDDGGSSGELRRRYGLPALGDLRQCLSALATDREAAARFEQRLEKGPSGVEHAAGNLALAERALLGGVAQAVAESAAALSALGTVLPVSEQAAVLEARREDGSLVQGEARIGDGSGRVSHLRLDPAPAAHPLALEAIADADMVVLGPGSLVTSVLPHLVIPDVSQALRASTALRVHVANLQPQPGETEGLDLSGHVRLLLEHAGPVIDLVLAGERRSRRDVGDGRGLDDLGLKLQIRPLARADAPDRHDPDRLAAALLELLPASDVSD